MRNSFDGVTPVILSSPFTVLVNNAGIPDSGQLSYPFRKAIVIEEIRFDLRMVSTSSLQLGANLNVKLQLGQHYLMRDPVPVWLLGTSMTTIEEESTDTSLATRVCYSHYRWRLPEPLYVEAGQWLQAVFSRTTDAFAKITGTIHGQITYVGKTVSPKQPRPKVLAVPYVAPFVTTVAQTYQQSNENNLFNPFDIPIRIQRLTGRVLNSNARLQLALTPTTPTGDVTIMMNDSWGGKMVNNLTGPSDVFDCLRAAWTVDTVMPPKGIYEIRAWNIPTTEQLYVAMVGVREEPI